VSPLHPHVFVLSAPWLISAIDSSLHRCTESSSTSLDNFRELPHPSLAPFNLHKSRVRRASGFLLTAFSNATPHTFFSLEHSSWRHVRKSTSVIRELTKPSCYIRRYRKDFGQLVDVKRNKNLLDSQCVGCVYARSAMRGKERSTEPRQA
jgi:hypothetical protein